MDAVKSFNAELSSLYEVKPPISKAKMTAITRGAIKAIKFYKHVVQSVEKFILKCKPEYKVPGLYVIDSIVRQSRHQFGADKDVFAPRFAKNMRQTFINLFVCPGEDKSKIIRVLNLWQKNQVFAPDVIQPLFDLADPNNPIHKELGTPLQSNGMNTNPGVVKGSPALQKTPTKGSQQGVDGAHLGGANLNMADPNVLVQLQQLQRLLTRTGDSSSKSESQVHFDRKLLDFDYGDEDDEAHSSPKAGPGPGSGPNDSVSRYLLTNPEVLRQLQTIQQTMTAGQTGELDIDKLRKLQEMKQQEEEFDKHLAQTVPNLPFAAECEFKPGNNSSLLGSSYYLPPAADLTQPPPGYKPQQPYEIGQPPNMDNDVQFVGGEADNGADVEVITLDHGDSRSPTPADDRYSRRRRSRSRERSRERRDRDRRSRRSRSRSKSRRHRSRSRERNRAKEKESEKDKERKKRGLPTIKKDNLSVCSTTLWVGHLSKLVHQEDLSNTFGEFGDIVSIDLIPPRGCAFIVMHRRQDAARCLTKLKNHMLHGKAITLAWAPGKGVKGKDLKDYWEGDLGVSYIPWHKLKPDIDLEMLEDGGMIDEDTMPAWMKAKVAAVTPNKPASITTATVATDSASYMAAVAETSRPSVDTSQPPPVPGTGLLQPPPMALPLVSPFQFSNRLLGMNIPPGMLPNVPIGVPPPNISSAMMPNQLVGLGSPFQGHTGLMQQMSLQNSDKGQANASDVSIKNLSESLMNMAQPFGMIPQPPIGLPAPHDDNMDIEMEDAEKPERPPLLSEQLQSLVQFSQNSHRPNPGGLGSDMSELDMDRRDKRGDRNRERRDSHSRERDRDRNRDRDRGRGMTREGPYSDRDDSRGRDRKDDRRERPNRWGERDLDPIERREREKTLNDRLQQMAMPNDVPYSNHDRPPRDLEMSDPEVVMHAELLERRMYPPHKGPPMNPDIEDLYPMRGPPDDYDMNGPPLMDDYPPMMEHPDDWLDEPRMDGPMLPRMHRDEYDHERYGRGRRDFRDKFEPRGRGLPGPGPDFYPPRDGFGPRPMMRGGPDFPPPRPPLMRGPGPHKFHPRGPPPMRGPRPNAPWKDRPGFGPRFDHPDFHRGPPGPPGMYDDPPHMRHRGRFDDRRRSRPEFGHENAPEGDRFQKRSRWGDSHEDNPREADQSQSVEANGADNKEGEGQQEAEPAPSEAPAPEEAVVAAAEKADEATAAE
ncbi:SR-related and CTD-associated factor 8 isoform X3 [Tenebrio molitor]|uniref:SR-related and CTD-associated factor 8 isoform X3 n=1 Tax=Tenebrio molitor TaxID=7067 RepID=UPI003624A07B